MEKLTVYPSSLNGQVRISGAKNSALRLLAASLLTSGTIRLQNYPSTLLDAVLHVRMLEALGKKCRLLDKNTIDISEEQVPSSELVWSERSIRNTLLILGALVARTGKGKVPLPGGCKLGNRKYDLHIMLLKALGADVWEEQGYICAEAKVSQQLIGTDIYLPLRSTGATENSIIAACLAKGVTRVWGPHIRPEILDLVNFLNSIGAKITVYGQESIVVEGVTELGQTTHRVIPDNVEALTWLIGAAITDGDIEIADFPFEHLEIPLIHLRESGVRFYRMENHLIVRGSTCYPIDISTGPYPGINSDMQPLFAVLGAVAKGESRIVDLRFPGRYAYAEELSKMGMKYKVSNNLLMIDGGHLLKGGETVQALDLRAGAALLIGGCVSKECITIENAWQISRGYDRLQEKLSQLGVKFSAV
ncbi:udp-n-acetylglucosamine 1-carboxyvinyltransferase [Leptolyngbya sp. Heron Island J]|uniref:UDP-N-acetylglucosamine 1-carboxyvinyltransferase n=1 Tax=Leptolyngbya sp. Heron Island J TaxID=1385935 RepID=UPI0003B93E7F|nr:UDP-N-acetylglucosamine 1-carboxyvinyltransferase [Leptolyngbya sp. Heron Island J]ESA38754.1 udp-n-acetylglucosamine 1-carboxyvinyltransferase [Leptolyngbya sp. Heron Island J]